MTRGMRGVIDGRVKSAYGTVHYRTTRVRLGLRTTSCGIYVDRGWGKTRDEVSCRSCIARAGEVPIGQKASAA